MEIGAVQNKYSNPDIAMEKSNVTEGLTYQQIIRNKIEELHEKIKNGETEESYPIGAESFTEREWDKLLERFDAVQDEIRELMREEHEKRKEEQIKQEELREKEEERKQIEEDSEMLISESTISYRPVSTHEEKEIFYITWYTKKGIYCRKVGQKTGYEWQLWFEREEQYEKVMKYLRQFSAKENLEFASDENFWIDFLKGGFV